MKVITFLFAALLFVGCGTVEKGYSPIDLKAKNYAEALKSADKSCQIDADCTSVSKGCCLCHGKEAVNKDAANALKSFWLNECATAACTLQMCYVEINTSCQKSQCVGTPKPMREYAAF